MFDEMRTALEVAIRAGARVEPTASDPKYRLGVAELRRQLDTLEAEYGRLAAPVDVSWMAQATGSTVQRARQHVEVGTAMAISPALAEAVRAGDVALENVAVLSAVASHPMFESSPLIDAASVLTPSKLRAKVEQWRAVVDRDADETHDRVCHRRRSLKFFRNLDGMVRLEGLFEAETGRILRNAVDTLVRGQRLDESGRTREQRNADALIELANAFNAGTVTGGREGPQMLVTLDAEQLAMRAGGRALLDTGETITIEAARRIACDADIATVLLRGPSEILDFGRSRRLASNTQYKALVVRDRGCRFPGCDRPPGWTQAHHIVQWPDGGLTDLDNLVLLCHTHHGLIHHQHWRIEGNTKNLKIHPPPDDGPARASPPRALAAGAEKTYVAMFLVVLHRSGPQWNASRPLEEQSDWAAHAAFMDGLVDEGFIVLGGPLADEVRVVHAVEAESEEAVRATLGRDPWSETHLRVDTIEPWTIRLDGRRN